MSGIAVSRVSKNDTLLESDFLCDIFLETVVLHDIFLESVVHDQTTDQLRYCSIMHCRTGYSYEGDPRTSIVLYLF